MTREKAVSGIWAFALALCLSLSSMLCVVTAFDLGVSVAALTLCCILAALVCSVCFTLPLKLVPPGIAALALGYLWQSETLELSLEALLNRLTRQYDRAYNWGIIRWGLRTADEMEPTIAVMLCILGAAIAMAVCWSVCRGKSALPALALSVLSVATCFVVNDTVPGTVCLYFLLLGVITLLLTGKVRRQDAAQGNRLSLVLVPVTALALLVLLAAVPRATYRGQANAQRLVDAVLNADPTQLLMGNSGGDSGGEGSVDLTDVGFRVESDAEVMAVRSDFDGTLYLRSRAMNTYNGKTWEHRETAPAWTTLDWPDMLWEEGTVTITTRYAHRMLYTPYYLAQNYMRDIPSGKVNKNELTEYTYDCLAISDLLKSPAKLYPTPDTPPRGQAVEGITSYPVLIAPDGSGSLEHVSGEVGIYFAPVQPFLDSVYIVSGEMSYEELARFITLPETVKKWAVPLASEITGDVASPYHRAQAIAEYVRNSAVYDTATPRMPIGQRDFVRWFLEDSDKGYCVHFASAAAVLLQAAGLPARYVTGYMTTVKAGETTPVAAKQSHAWVEYWLPGFGWTVLEATPADLREQVQTEPTEQTLPDETLDPDMTVPEDDPTLEQDRESLWPVVLPVLLWLVAGCGVIGLVWGQRKLRLAYRQKQFDKCSPNEQALFLWQQTVLLARLTGSLPNPALFYLAEKAKYSPYTVTDAELALFADAITELTAQLQKRSVLHRLYYRIILVIY